MKKVFIYITMLAVAMAGISSCEYDSIPEHDNFSKYKGVSGTIAYIAGGTNSMANATDVTIQHTPDGELGTIQKELVLALTSAQTSDVALTIGLDNDAVASTYAKFPEGVLQFDKPVVIKAGQLSDTVTVSVNKEDFSKFVESKYQAVLCITGVSGGKDVKISTNSNKALLNVETQTVDPSTNIVSTTGGTYKFAIKNYTNVTEGNTISRTFSVMGTEAAYDAFEVKFEVDNSLIDAYNQQHNTEYQSVPSSIYTLANATMPKGGTYATASFSIADENRSQLTDERGYLVPVVLKSAAPATVQNNTVNYIIVEVTNINAPSTQFSALYLGNKEMASWFKFSNGIDVTDGFLYVFHVFTEENVGQQRVGNISDTNEYWINMLRFGEGGRGGEVLEWWVGPNQNRKKLYASVTAKAWHQVALYYDGDNYVFYVDKTEQARYTLTADDKAKNNSITFQGIEFANSWGDSYRSAYKGRLWHFSVFAGVSSENVASVLEDTYMNMPSDMTQSPANYGLKAYWPMDEGSGSLLNETTGLYENIDFTRMTRCNDETNWVSFDASPYLTWKKDEYNKL